MSTGGEYPMELLGCQIGEDRNINNELPTTQQV